MRDWNVVVSVHDRQFVRACQLLSQFGRVERTEYYNVLVMKVADRAAFLDAWGAAARCPTFTRRWPTGGLAQSARPSTRRSREPPRT